MRRQDYFERYDRIARLNSRPIVEASKASERLSVREWFKSGNLDQNSFNVIALGIIAIIALAIGMVIISQQPIPQRQLPVPQSAFLSCYGLPCHLPTEVPIIKDGQAYAEFHRGHPKFSPASNPDDMRLLTELVRP